MDRQLGNTMKRARSSRIIDGPDGVSARPGDQDGPEEPSHAQQNMQIVHDRNPEAEQEQIFGMQQMALDDIPRIVQAEVTKEIRPNAAKYAGNNLVSSERAKLLNGHRRSISGGNELDRYGQSTPRQRRYFGELTPLEYIIARTVAVLYLEQLLEGHFTHQELIELVETKRPTFWGRFNKAFKNDKSQGKKKGVFGRTIEQVVQQDGAESTDGVGPGALRVPAVIENCVSAMRNMDMSVEGVFRKNGNMRKLKEQAELIDTQGCDAVDLTKEQPVQVAVLLKKFLREMPEPLLTFKLHKIFLTAASKYFINV
jgi:RhoGAP domain